MKVAIKIHRTTLRTVVLEWHIPDMRYEDMRALWTLEQIFNNLPHTPYRMHVDVIDDGRKGE